MGKLMPVTKRHLTDQRELVEGIATFAELLRDSVSSSSGLEQAIRTVADACPAAVRPAVVRLTASMRYVRTDDALRQFADDLAHPTSDFVVAALLTATQHQTRDLAGLLTQLSESAREECRLYMRVWVSRARTRSAVRIVGASLAVFVVSLMLFSPGYLAPYASPAGFVALAAVSCGFACGLYLLDRMAAFSPPARLIAGRQ